MSRSSFEALPAKGPRPHDFFELPHRRVTFEVVGLSEPLGMSYVDAGEGEPLLLVHGLLTSGYSFRYVISELARHYRVIVPDLPGAGRSDAPLEMDQSPPGVARVLAAFTEALELGPAYVVGNSLGGYLCAWYALLHPEPVSRLMIMHAPGIPELRMSALKYAFMVPGSGLLFRALTRDAKRFVIKNQHYRDPAITSQEEVLEYAAAIEDETRRAVFVRILREALDPAQMRAFAARWGEIRDEGEAPMPIVLLWSREDVMVPPALGPKYQALIPQAELVWIDDSSHFLQVDTPEETIEAILRFGGRIDSEVSP